MPRVYSCSKLLPLYVYFMHLQYSVYIIKAYCMSHCIHHMHWLFTHLTAILSKTVHITCLLINTSLFILHCMCITAYIFITVHITLIHHCKYATVNIIIIIILSLKLDCVRYQFQSSSSYPYPYPCHQVTFVYVNCHCWVKVVTEKSIWSYQILHWSFLCSAYHTSKHVI